MTRNEIVKRYPNASESFIRANLGVESDRPRAVVEHDAGDEPLAANQGKKGNSGIVHVRFVVARKRLCDPDNLCVKYLLDCCRYCGAIEGDEPEKISLEIVQRKCAKDEPEHCLIQIFNQ